VEGAEHVDVRAERLDALHREEEADAAVGSGRLDLGAVAADGEAGIVRDLLVEKRDLVHRDAKGELRQVAVVDEDRGAHDPDSAVVESLPEVAPEDADRLAFVGALLVEVEQQVEMEIDDAAVDAAHVCAELFGRWRPHGVIMAIRKPRDAGRRTPEEETRSGVRQDVRTWRIVLTMVPSSIGGR
jgi:hypothetical protein